MWPPACCAKKDSQRPRDANGPPQPEPNPARKQNNSDPKEGSKPGDGHDSKGNLAAIPEERPGEDTTPQGISGDALDETQKGLLGPEQHSAVAVVPAAFSPQAEAAKGSMKDLEKHRPNQLGFRSFSETV